MSEAGALALFGIGLKIALFYAVLVVARPFAARQFGLRPPVAPFGPRDSAILGSVVLAGFVAGCAPAIWACRLSLANGLWMRI